MRETVHFRVTGMTCGGCENAVTRTLRAMRGVDEATASHKDERVDVTYDNQQLTVDDMRQRIASLGYTVTS